MGARSRSKNAAPGDRPRATTRVAPTGGPPTDYDPVLPRRRSVRLKAYDYAQPGAYFVTAVTQDRLCLFGDIADGEVRLNEAGRLIGKFWESLPDRFAGIALDLFVVMPNHIHGVIAIDPPVGAPLVGARSRSKNAAPGDRPRATTRVAPTGGGGGYALSDVIGAYKSLTTADYARRVTADGWPSFPGRLWQRNYYEHVVRGEDDMERIRAYIHDNPLKWEMDSENPAVAAAQGRRLP